QSLLHLHQRPLIGGPPRSGYRTLLWAPLVRAHRATARDADTARRLHHDRRPAGPHAATATTTAAVATTRTTRGRCAGTAARLRADPRTPELPRRHDLHAAPLSVHQR